MLDLALMRLMSRKRQRQHCPLETRHHGSIGSYYKGKGTSCQANDTHGGEGIRSAVDLPEDICQHIHGLMPMRDAARLACVSHAFLSSWRCHPNLSFSEEALGLNVNIIEEDKIATVFINKVDHILQNHSGVGMKKLELKFASYVDFCHFDRWLHIAVTSGVEELTISLPSSIEDLLPSSNKEKYNFPCSLLFNGRSKNSIRYLRLSGCACHPTAALCCSTNLTRLFLCRVQIADNDIESILGNCFALEWLKLMSCDDIFCLKIPSLMQRLCFVQVSQCRRLQVIESNAPNISTFLFGGPFVQISLGDALQVKNIRMSCPYQYNVVWYARTKLLPTVPNIETLTISSPYELISTPMVPGKFLHLKYLSICFYGNKNILPAYDYLSLVSFLEASPCLETFICAVSESSMQHDSVIGDASHLRQLPEHRHDNLKRVVISGFCNAKSLIELTSHIVERTTSLESLTLDTTYGGSGRLCSADKPGKCAPMGRDILMKVSRALLAIRTHIVGKVPSRVKLNILEPCSKCYAVEL